MRSLWPAEGAGDGHQDGFDVPSILLELRSVVIAELDLRGRVYRASRGFRRLMPRADPAADVRPLFIQPAFDALCSTLAEGPDAPVFTGLLTLGELEGSSESIRGAVYRRGERLLLIGEYDVEELEALAGTVVSLNEELAESQRELVRKNRALEQLSLTDPLTGVGNRRELDRRLDLEIARCQRLQRPLSVIAADLDHFKGINDRHGHPVGDRVLRRFAELLVEGSRDYDLVVRSGGEEFALVLPESGLAAATEIAERLRRRLGGERIEPLQRPVTASFGVVQWAPQETAAAVLGRADAALYRAKATGRDRVVAMGTDDPPPDVPSA